MKDLFFNTKPKGGKKPGGCRLLLEAMLCVAFLITCIVPASAQYNYSLSGPTALLSNTWMAAYGAANVAATNAVADGIPIKRNVGVGLLTHYLCGQDSNTVAYTVYFDASPDGLKWTTDPAFFITFKGRGTTNSMSFTNIPASVLGPASYIRPKSLSIPGAGTNEFYITNIFVYYPY